jgi:hypothetical protein
MRDATLIIAIDIEELEPRLAPAAPVIVQADQSETGYLE